MRSKNSRFHPIKFAILANSIMVSLVFQSLWSDCNGKEIPSIAMATGSVEEFQMNPFTRKECPKKSLTYYVKKLQDERNLDPYDYAVMEKHYEVADFIKSNSK